MEPLILGLVRKLLATEDLVEVQAIGAELRLAIRDHIESLRAKVPSPATDPYINPQRTKKPRKRKNGDKA